MGRVLARTRRCATGLCERASKIVECGTSMSWGRVRMAWRCGDSGEVVVSKSGERRVTVSIVWKANIMKHTCGLSSGL